MEYYKTAERAIGVYVTLSNTKGLADRVKMRDVGPKGHRRSA